MRPLFSVSEILLGVALFVGIVAFSGYAMTRQRRTRNAFLEDYRGFAATHGWEMAMGASAAVPLFRSHRPMEEQAFFSLRGPWKERTFSLYYFLEEGDGRSTPVAACVVASPVLPATTVLAGDALSTAFHPGRLDETLETELEAFGGSFTVSTNDREFALAFLDQRMMAWLLAHPYEFDLETGSFGVATFTAGWPDVEELPAILERATELAQAIPRVIYELHGAGGETKPGEIA